ncbi:MAG: tyrosine-type recombinase/integrase [Phycisphaerae bacterium]|nr:tyrosine-type recombinase/integrase [Phycisphaerae bacterium]
MEGDPPALHGLRHSPARRPCRKSPFRSPMIHSSGMSTLDPPPFLMRGHPGESWEVTALPHSPGDRTLQEDCLIGQEARSPIAADCPTPMRGRQRHSSAATRQEPCQAETNHEGKRLDFHSLRQTCGAWLALNGANVKTVQSIMRHSTPVLTLNTYGHLHPGEESKTIANLPTMTPDDREAVQATGTDDAVASPSDDDHPREPAVYKESRRLFLPSFSREIRVFWGVEASVMPDATQRHAERGRSSGRTWAADR